MNYQVGEYLLSRPEDEDLEYLYQQKNDPEVAQLLGGFSHGYSKQDLREWLEYHRKRNDEVLFVIREKGTNKCIGHVGLYRIDHRARTAEFAIMIGDKSAWGKRLGRAFTEFAMEYAFNELNLNRMELSLLSTNKRAEALYRSLKFSVDGILREAQYKNGNYIDVIVMSILRSEYNADRS